MARSKNPVPADRFQTPAAAPVQRLGFSSLPAGRYVKRDQYGFHILRVLADGQEVLFTVTPSGMGVEKINFVPSKDRRDGNAAYGNRWLGILAYRQSDEHAADLELAGANGLRMEPEAKKASANPSGGWANG
jgi:hypothetical protein